MRFLLLCIATLKCWSVIVFGVFGRQYKILFFNLERAEGSRVALNTISDFAYVSRGLGIAIVVSCIAIVTVARFTNKKLYDDERA